MNKRKQQAIETKQKLLDAADALVKEKGFDAMSVDEIVALCGVAKGTFYHYFETKDDLLDFLMDHMPNPEGLNDNDRRSQYDGLLSQLKHWYEG